MRDTPLRVAADVDLGQLAKHIGTEVFVGAGGVQHFDTAFGVHQAADGDLTGHVVTALQYGEAEVLAELAVQCALHGGLGSGVHLEALGSLGGTHGEHGGGQ